MKKFEKPTVEIYLFDNDIIKTSDASESPGQKSDNRCQITDDRRQMM